MNQSTKRISSRAWIPLALSLLVSGSAHEARSEPANPTGASVVPRFVREYTRAMRFPGGEGALSLDSWKRLVPKAEPVKIRSSADGTEQSAMFFDSGTRKPKPLLVVLHSWSTDWRQNIGIPYAMFAERNDWAFIHPDFRGPYRRPEAAASDLVAADIVDAVEYAKKHADVDPSRIYLAGFSGGGMTALAMAGRRPDLWAGVVASAPIHDMPDWYRYNSKNFPKRHYANNLTSVCGGAPRPGTPAYRVCEERSPSALLERARSAGVPVYIACGLSDDIVPPEHALRAYNQLANPDGRLGEEIIRHIDKKAQLPALSVEAYARAGAPLRFERTSGNVTLTFFEGVHDIVYEPGLAWLMGKRRPTTPAKANP